MPLLRSGRPLKRWRYVGVFDARLMLCVADVRVGPLRQTWWAVWDRARRRLRERTTSGRGGVRLGAGAVHVDDGAVRIDLALEEDTGVEVVNPHGRSYVWTRKQGDVPARGAVVLDGERIELDTAAIVDDSAGYHARRTVWRWSAGLGRGDGGERVAWNLVEGINDAPRSSERTVWVDGVPSEPDPVRFAPSLDRIAFADGAELRFAAEAERAHDERYVIMRSRYRQPFGTFAGTLPGGLALAEGFGVMEEHDVRW